LQFNVYCQDTKLIGKSVWTLSNTEFNKILDSLHFSKVIVTQLEKVDWSVSKEKITPNQRYEGFSEPDYAITYEGLSSIALGPEGKIYTNPDFTAHDNRGQVIDLMTGSIDIIKFTPPFVFTFFDSIINKIVIDTILDFQGASQISVTAEHIYLFVNFVSRKYESYKRYFSGDYLLKYNKRGNLLEIKPISGEINVNRKGELVLIIKKGFFMESYKIINPNKWEIVQESKLNDKKKMLLLNSPKSEALIIAKKYNNTNIVDIKTKKGIKKYIISDVLLRLCGWNPVDMDEEGNLSVFRIETSSFEKEKDPYLRIMRYNTKLELTE
jgi:hypothetical protein